MAEPSHGSPDWLSLAGGLVIGLIGLGMLVSLDVPTIEHGGWASLFAALELLTAIALLSAGIGLAARGVGKEGY